MGASGTRGRCGDGIAVGRDDEHAGGLPAQKRRSVQRERDRTEYFDVAPHPAGGQLLIVTTFVEDPRYLQRPYIVSSHFKKEADASKWDPTPCSATW